MKKLLGSLALILMLVTAAVSGQAVSAETKPVVASSQAYSITPEAISQAIAKELEAKGGGKNIDVKLFGNNRDAAYAYPTPITLKIEDLQFEPKAGTFNAMLSFESQGQTLTPSRVTGRYDEMVEVPTLKQRLFQGDVIAETDLVTTRLPGSRLRKGTILDKASLIGRTPVRVISANRAILPNDIASPAMVRKGDQITLRYVSGNLTINALGEALDPGTVGDKIRVKNTSSNKVIQAEIKSKDLATVQNLIQTAEDRNR